MSIKELEKELKIETKEEKIATGYITLEYDEITYKDYKLTVKPVYDSEVYDILYDGLKENYDCILVNYHRDFHVTSDIIDEETVRGLYTGEIDWDKKEKELRYWIFYLSCLIHGEVWLKLGYTGFSSDPGGWDTSHVGLVLVRKDIYKTRKEAEQAAVNYVGIWNKVLSGDVYDVKVYKNEEEIDNFVAVGKDEVYEYINNIENNNNKGGNYEN